MPLGALRSRQNRKTRGRKPPTLAKLKKRAWKLLSELVRRKDTRPSTEYVDGCISCYTCGEIHHWKSMQAGHAIGGRTGSVLLDEEIIRPQCYRCNCALRGNYPVFIAKLIREKAKELEKTQTLNVYQHALDWWESKLQSSRQIKKWDRAELQAKIESYKARLSVLT